MAQRQPDALRALELAKKDAIKLAEKRKAEDPPLQEVTDDEAACFVHLAISCYRYGMVVGLGAMPDGTALWLRLRFPATSDDPRAGMVAFVVSDDSLGLLQKAVAALEATAKSRWWKVDQFAAQREDRQG